MATQIENEKTYTLNAESFQEGLFPHYRRLLKEFRRLSKQYVLFHLLFIILFLIEGASLLLLSAMRADGALLSLTIGSLFLTCFSYSICLFYFQSKRPKQLFLLKEDFVASARKEIGIPRGELEHHLCIAHALSRVASYLEDFEKHLYRPFEIAKNLKPLLEKWSLLCHFKDVFMFKKLFQEAAIEEHLEQIRITPSDYEVHTSLANSYFSLFQTYQEPAQFKDHFLYKVSFKALLRETEEKAKDCLHLAIEEYKILAYYAPNDPFVHFELAKCYQNLSLPEEEIKEYEVLLTLRPLDKEALFRLGTLYFQQSKNAKGLQIYEDLKKANFKKAEELIAHYGKK